MRRETYTSLILGGSGSIMLVAGVCLCFLPILRNAHLGLMICAMGIAAMMVMQLIKLKMNEMRDPDEDDMIEINGDTITTIIMGLSGTLSFISAYVLMMMYNLAPSIMVLVAVCGLFGMIVSVLMSLDIL